MSEPKNMNDVVDGNDNDDNNNNNNNNGDVINNNNVSRTSDYNHILRNNNDASTVDVVCTTEVSTTTSNPTATLSSTTFTHRSNSGNSSTGSSPIVVSDSNNNNNNNNNSNNVTSQSAAIAVAVMDSDVVTPSAHSTSQNNNNNNNNNNISISSTTKSPFTLPNGEIMNSKNTLQSFVVVPTAVGSGQKPTTTTTTTTTTNNNNNNNNNTNNNNNITIPSLVHDSQQQQQQHDKEPFRLPNGEMMDSKNTLQSFAAAGVVSPPILEHAMVDENHQNNNTTIHQHYHNYRLPNGEIINAKNINQSYENCEYGNRDRNVDHNETKDEEEQQQQQQRDTTTAASNNINHNNNNPLDNIVHAVAVDSFAGPTAMVVEAEAVDSLLRREDEQRQMIRKRVYYGVAILIVLVGTISVTAGYCGAGQCSPQPKDIEKVQVPPESMADETPILKADIVTSYINNITLSNRIIRSTGTSAEDAALRWLINDDPIFTDTMAWSSLILYPNATVETAEQIRIRQRYSLLTLWFQQLNNDDGVFEPTWFNTTGWLNDTNECNWYGITCDSSLVVIGIDFQGNDDRSDLFGNITTGNNVTGTMPMDIGLLSNIQTLNLLNNEFTGLLPSTMREWNFLEFFSVGVHPLKGKRPFLGTLPPSTIGQWTKLQYFSTRFSKFSGTIPSSIGTWTSLKHFDVHDNEFTGLVPPSIGKWTALTSFTTSSNRFSGTLPNGIGLWTQLTSFDISDNGLSGTLPRGIGQWTQLISFDTSGSFLFGTLPVEIGQWTQLKFFDISFSGFRKTLPVEIVQWTQLTYFDISSTGSSVGGTLPNEIGQWTNLAYFNVTRAFLYGSLPSGIGRWTKLTYFSVRSNSLRGTIPSTIGNWSSIEHAYFDDNNLVGTIPMKFCTTVLIPLCVDDNVTCGCCSCTGIIPPEDLLGDATLTTIGGLNVTV